MRDLLRPSIDARAAWHGQQHECNQLYRQFVHNFGGSFKRITAYYGWKPAAMLKALRQGRIVPAPARPALALKLAA